MTTHTDTFLTDIADRAAGRRSAYAIAQYMGRSYGWSRTSAYNYWRGQTYPSEAHALDIATELGLDPGYVLACVSADRARDTRVRAGWEKAAQRLADTATVVIMSATAVLGVAGQLGAPGLAAPGGSLMTSYVLCAI
jgi:hypothetical protein